MQHLSFASRRTITALLQTLPITTTTRTTTASIRTMSTGQKDITKWASKDGEFKRQVRRRALPSSPAIARPLPLLSPDLTRPIPLRAVRCR